MEDDRELEELRRRKLAELQQQGAYERDDSAMRAEQENAKENVLRQVLEPEARERLTRVRMARPDIAATVENQLLSLYQSGRVRSRIDDATLRQILARFTPKTRDTTIERR